jgi:hypothetical protein
LPVAPATFVMALTPTAVAPPGQLAPLTASVPLSGSSRDDEPTITA